MIKPCIVCGSPNMRCEQHYLDAYRCYGTVYKIVCADCDTVLSNYSFEDSRTDTIEWFNDLPRLCLEEKSFQN